MRLLEVGRVTGPHGIRGKLRVQLYPGDAGGAFQVRRVWLSGRDFEREFEVVEAQRAGGCALFSLRGIGTEEEARGLAGARVSVLREELPDLPEDEFYWVDAVGCSLVDEAGEPIGEVTGVMAGAAHDWLVVVRPNGEEAYLPVVEAFVRKVDIPARRIVASPPEGW
jgi:16S rRNA processing protein RimM